MEEIWKDINGFENYLISSFGNVKRKKCQIVYANGVKSNYPEKILNKEKVKGYLRVTLSKSGETKRFAVHRLVGLHFIENKFKSPCVNHIDGDKTNNIVTNLEWCTYSENERHSYDVLGKKPSRCKLSHEQVIDIRKNCIKSDNRYKKGNVSFFINKYNVNRHTVLNALNNVTYV